MVGEERPSRIDAPVPDEAGLVADLVRQCPDMLSVHDVGGRYTYVSPACRLLLGYEPEELVGRDGYSMMHPDDVAVILEAHDAMMSHVDEYVLRGRCRHKDGHWVWMESTVRMVRDARTGQPHHGVASSRRVVDDVAASARLFVPHAETERSVRRPERTERTERTGRPGRDAAPARRTEGTGTEGEENEAGGEDPRV